MNGKLTATLSARGRLKATLSKAIERVEPIIKPLEVTENGEYTASENVHGFNPVKVDVPLKYDEGYNDGYQASQDSIKLQEKTATENGEIVTDEGFTGMSKVTVAVPIKEEQEKTVDITANGTVEVVPDEGKVMSKVTANVAVNPTDVGKPYIDTSKMTSFVRFCSNDKLNNQLDLIDTSKGTSFAYMFDNCRSLTAIPPLDTSKGTAFTNMFNECRTLVTIPQLDTSNGEEFAYMFYGCRAITSIPLIDTSKGDGLSYMFYNCTKLETVSITTAKSNLSTNTFQNCTALQNITIGEGWAVNIYLHYSNNLTVESLHGMIENLADLTGQTAKTFQVGPTNLAKIDQTHLDMLVAKNWNHS